MDLWEWPKGILNYWRLKLSTWLFGISSSPISRSKFLENSNLKKRKMIADWIAYYKSCTSGTFIFHINYCTFHLTHLYLSCYPPVPICTSHLHQPSRLPNCDSWWANSGGNPADWRCHIMWEKYWWKVEVKEVSVSIVEVVLLLIQTPLLPLLLLGDPADWGCQLMWEKVKSGKACCQNLLTRGDKVICCKRFSISTVDPKTNLNLKFEPKS